MSELQIYSAQKALELIAHQAPLHSIESFLTEAMANVGCNCFKFSWLDDTKKETLWFEEKYQYQFSTQKIFISYQKREILVLYYFSERDISSVTNLLQALAIHVYLTTAYRTKNDRRFMREDLELASKMQQLLVPKNLYCNRSFCASGLYIPNYKVGGDFYDVIPINDYKIGFCIGDISGKGINAAIIMAHFIGFIRSTLLRNIKLEEAIRLINAKMYELTEGEKFITLFLAVYNTEDKRLVYINSGHVPIPLYDAQETTWLETGSTLLGIFKELPFIELGKIEIVDKKQLLLYTDGLLNLSIDHEPMLSAHELDYILHTECLNKNPDAITALFREKVKGIHVAEDLQDDISLLAVEVG